MTKRELFLTGLFLYWGEGGKTSRGQVSISNTDPAVLQFSLYWMKIALGIPKEKISVRLHLYDDMYIETEIEFWHRILNISKTQFAKPYIKISKKTDLDEKGYGHGTCNLIVSNTVIKQKILMTLKAISDYSKQHISAL